MNLPKDGGIMARWKTHGWTFLSRAKSAQLLSEAISGSFSKCLRNDDRSIFYVLATQEEQKDRKYNFLFHT